MKTSREFRVESLEQKPESGVFAIADGKFIVVTLDSRLSALD